MPTQPRFSVIIPAYNEESYLPRLLDSVEEARKQYSAGFENVEIVVSNNASTDLTADVAISRGCRVAEVTKRTIGSARNGGAAIARGDIFCFIDADSAIHPKTFDAIEKAMLSGRYVGGATGIYPERMSLGLLVTYLAFIPIVILTGMDTGMVFCRREDFHAIGGYDEDLLFAEDVKFLWALRKLGKRCGQTLARLTEVKALGSTRKFDKYGDWHYFSMPFRLIFGFLTGREAESQIAEEYWYKAER
jgi:glycosyltransferase involved in cell wall biosynthesis